MPIYEFVCNSCKKPVSVFVRSMSSEVNAKCDNCGSTDLTRQISTFAFLGATGTASEGGGDDLAGMMGAMGGMGGMGGMGDFGGMGGMDDFGDDF